MVVVDHFSQTTTYDNVAVRQIHGPVQRFETTQSSLEVRAVGDGWALPIYGAAQASGYVGPSGCAAFGPPTTKLRPIRQTTQHVRAPCGSSQLAGGDCEADRNVPRSSACTGRSLVELWAHALYTVGNATICHAVVPQYNTHGNYFIGSSKVDPYQTSPSSCADDSFPFDVYFYHASIGFYSFYEAEVGTYCTKEKTAYIRVEALGTYDINESFLAKDTGSVEPRISYWYTIVGSIWLMFRLLTIRRSFVLCIRYGRRCDQMGDALHQQEAIVFVQESLRLSAHGATNYQRAVLLYLIVGIMTDLFLIIANDGWIARVQYASLGYNLSGLMLLLFEMVENMKWLSEKWRLRIKRVFFSYETALVGELVTALGFRVFCLD
ncbi:unnamed protein product [Phytophthora lilii]|uniref:Unnamed protein product n=1 Tax=Phytophthora lilii TaxID=2077276 RepID=A0A9W6WS08_9STRA|nr:unnamed protein product [Phytophthora lilii]